MNFKKINNLDFNYFVDLIGKSFVLYDEEELKKYSHDETEDLIFFPELVLKPANSQEVSKIMSYCFENNIAVTPCGARTGLSGGSLPIYGGISLSLERFNKILNIDEENLQATVEPGVINQKFKDLVKEKGLFYPPDPASMGSCFLGGNLAENAGGPKALKYGVTKDYVLNLEVVLSNGDIIWTGANVLKNSTGYNITQLMIGSEGTLGIITKIVFKLIPHPLYDVTMLVPFKSSQNACKAVSAVFKAGIIPSALEFMEKDAIDLSIKFSDSNFKVQKNVEAHLLIEIDGFKMNEILDQCEKVSDVMQKYDSQEILFADSVQQKDQLCRLRRVVGEAVKSTSIYKEEDTVVPRAELPKLLKGVKKIGLKYGFKSICYGHAGDGNLHINILKGNMSDRKWNNELKKAIVEVFQLTVKLGGTISGEHGIGYVQKEYMPLALCSANLNIQKKIKKIFDSKGILNPGKIFIE